MLCAVDNSSFTLLTLTVCKSLNVHMHENPDLRLMDVFRETVSGCGQNSSLEYTGKLMGSSEGCVGTAAGNIGCEREWRRRTAATCLLFRCLRRT